MHIWLDIDNFKHIPFYKTLIAELKERGHTVTITAQNSREIKNALSQYQISAKVTGRIFSFFGMFFEQLNLIRSVLLLDYIKLRKIDIAFSLGSLPMLYTCVDADLPSILFLESYENKPHQLYLGLLKSYFILSDSFHDQLLIEHGYNSEKFRKYKGQIKKDDSNPDLKTIKEKVNQIEFLRNHIAEEVVG